MTGLGSTHLEAEISTQPDDWAAARAVADRYAELLPQRGERVAVVGCGTSLYMAQAISALREAAGHGVTDAWTPTEARLDRGYDRLIAITRSGTTTEVADLLREWGGRLPGAVITATPDTDVVGLTETILTPEVDEKSVVQTRFATTTLAMLRWHLGEDLQPVIDQARQVLADLPSAAGEDAGELGLAVTAEQLTFVGRGWTNGIAQEAGLKLRESAQSWTEAYPMTEYRHGPISVSAPGRVVWAFGDLVPNFAEDVAVTGAHFMHADIDAMADLIRVQWLCLLRARAQGLDPDQPRNLTRSIILPTAV